MDVREQPVTWFYFASACVAVGTALLYFSSSINEVKTDIALIRSDISYLKQQKEKEVAQKQTQLSTQLTKKY